MPEDAQQNLKTASVNLISHGRSPMISVDSKMYQEFRSKPNFQNLADNQMSKLIAAQQKRYDPKFFTGNSFQAKPSNLYQEYLQKAGLLDSKQKKKSSKIIFNL